LQGVCQKKTHNGKNDLPIILQWQTNPLLLNCTINCWMHLKLKDGFSILTWRELPPLGGNGRGYELIG
jgi:hypothetical protein